MKKLLYIACAGMLVWPVGALAQEGQPPRGEPGEDQQVQNQEENQGQDQAAEVSPEPEVELLNPGAEPRRALRYNPEMDRRERATFTNTMSVSMTADGQQMPAQEIPRITMVIGATTGVVVEDRFVYLFDVEDVQVGGANPVAGSRDEDVLRRALAPAIGVTGVAEVSRRGELRTFELAGVHESQVESLISQASQFTQMLPEESVGVGARWRVVTLQTNGDVQIEQTSTATLKSIKGDVATISFEVTQSADEQDVGQRMGQDMKLLHHSGEGKGETKLDLNRLVPLQSTSTIKTTMRMAIGPDRTFEQKLTVKTELSGELVEAEVEPQGQGGDDPAASGDR